MLNFLKVAESISIGGTPSFSKVSTVIHLTCSASTFVARSCMSLMMKMLHFLERNPQVQISNCLKPIEESTQENLVCGDLQLHVIFCNTTIILFLVHNHQQLLNLMVRFKLL